MGRQGTVTLTLPAMAKQLPCLTAQSTTVLWGGYLWASPVCSLLCLYVTGVFLNFIPLFSCPRLIQWSKNQLDIFFTSTLPQKRVVPNKMAIHQEWLSPYNSIMMVCFLLLLAAVFCLTFRRCSEHGLWADPRGVTRRVRAGCWTFHRPSVFSDSELFMERKQASKPVPGQRIVLCLFRNERDNGHCWQNEAVLRQGIYVSDLS